MPFSNSESHAGPWDTTTLSIHFAKTHVYDLVLKILLNGPSNIQPRQLSITEDRLDTCHILRLLLNNYAAAQPYHTLARRAQGLLHYYF